MPAPGGLIFDGIIIGGMFIFEIKIVLLNNLWTFIAAGYSQGGGLDLFIRSGNR